MDEQRKWIKTCSYKLITTVAEWEEYKKTAGLRVACDLETTGLNPYRHKVVGVSLCCEAGVAVYIPLNHTSNNFEGIEYFLKDFADFCKNRVIIFYNAKFDVEFLRNNDVPVPEYEDVMVSVYLNFPDAPSRGLKDSSDRLLGHKMISLKELFDPESPFYSYPETEEEKKAWELELEKAAKKNKPPRKRKVKETDFSILPPTGYACDYACSDVDMTFRLDVMLEKERATQSHVYNIERRLMPIVLEMENNRVMLDSDYFARMIRTVFNKLLMSEMKIFEAAGKKFDINSPKQTGDVLVGLGIPLPKHEKTGNLITDKKTLSIMQTEFPIIGDILTYRKYYKAISGYLMKLYQGGLDPTGVRFSFNQLATATGRFSSGKDKNQEVTNKRDLDSGYIGVNAQNIQANSEAIWFEATRIKNRRLKEDNTLCFEDIPAVLSSEEVELFENLKDRNKEPKIPKRKPVKEEVNAIG